MVDELKSVDADGVATIEKITTITMTVEEIDSEIAVLRTNMQTYQEQIDKLEALKAEIESAT